MLEPRRDSVEIGLLGPFAALGPNGPIRVGSRRERALLAFLALHVDSFVPFATLVEALWGEEPPPTAVPTVRTLLSRLRQALAASGADLRSTVSVFHAGNVHGPPNTSAQGADMPLYTCIVRPGDLSPEQKAALAGEITRIHCDVTGAPALFVHVFFNEVTPGNGFLGGKPLSSNAITGLIRAGRSPEDKARLLFGLSDAWSRVTGRGEREVMVAVQDVPAKNIVEDGVLLPEPGEEAGWLAEHGMASSTPD